MFVTESCLTVCDPIDCSPPGFSVHGILQARILEWVNIAFSRGSSWPRDRTQVSCIAGRIFTPRATREAPIQSAWGPINLLLDCKISDSSLVSETCVFRCLLTCNHPRGGYTAGDVLGTKALISHASTQSNHIIHLFCYGLNNSGTHLITCAYIRTAGSKVLLLSSAIPRNDFKIEFKTECIPVV